jgi:hypothetical protein
MSPTRRASSVEQAEVACVRAIRGEADGGGLTVQKVAVTMITRDAVVRAQR